LMSPNDTPSLAYWEAVGFPVILGAAPRPECRRDVLTRGSWMFINQTRLLLDNPMQLNYGIAVTDFDGDGAFELVVAGFTNAPNLILKWNGSGFVNVAPPILADPERQAIGVAAADIDGDGEEEIYILNT